MILTHKTRYCEIGQTRILRAPVFKHHIRNISPYKVYADNIEMFDAFSDTVANFCPISMNIIDYWNKTTRTHDTYVWVPIDSTEDLNIKEPAFGWEQSQNHGFKNENPTLNADGVDDDGQPVPGGFPTKTGDGRLFGEGRRSYVQGANEREDGSCIDSNKRFFINPIIGVQDKLAMTYLNNFYTAYYNARQNPTLRHRLLSIADQVSTLDPKKFFNKPNNLFTEEKTVANKTFIMKKGTPLGLKYAQKSAFDAELQGPQSRFYMDIQTPEPLVYKIKSNVLEDLFEKFVKPLAHPIGFTYDYKSVCKVQDDTVDHPMISHTYTSKRIEVNCLCKKEIKEKIESIECGGKDQPLPKVFALSESNLVDVIDPNDPTKTVKYMQGLWDGILSDAWGQEDSNGEIKFNILKNIESHVGIFRNEMHKFKKYIFENNNYLISWIIQPKVQDEAPKVIIEYYRVDNNTLSGWSNVITFENDIHCNISDNLINKRTSQITEFFKVDCVSVLDGPFIMDPDPKGPNGADANGPDVVVVAPIKPLGPDADGKYRGFTIDPATNPNNKAHGGKLVGWAIFSASIT